MTQESRPAAMLRQKHVPRRADMPLTSTQLAEERLAEGCCRSLPDRRRTLMIRATSCG